jgi:hypothetical protein
LRTKTIATKRIAESFDRADANLIKPELSKMRDQMPVNMRLPLGLR